MRTQVREWVRALPAEQLRLVRAEDWRAQPSEMEAELRAFLRLAPQGNRSAGHVAAGAADAMGGVGGAGVRLGDDVRAAVGGFYDEFDDELSQLADGDARFLFR